MTRQSNSSKRESDKREFYEIVSKFEVPIKESFAKIPENKRLSYWSLTVFELKIDINVNLYNVMSFSANLYNFQKIVV